MFTSSCSGDVGYSEEFSDSKKEKGVKTVRGKTILSKCKVAEKPSPPPAKKIFKPKENTSIVARTRRAVGVVDITAGGRPAKSKYLKKLPKEKLPKEKESEHLGKLCFHYCSAVGLIWAGIFPKPPGWDLQRIRYWKPRTKNDDEKVPTFRFQKKQKVVHVDGKILTTEYDYFDVTKD
jgi:hypothetical protein